MSVPSYIHHWTSRLLQTCHTTYTHSLYNDTVSPLFPFTLYLSSSPIPPTHPHPTQTAKIHSKPFGPTLPSNNAVTHPLVVLITGAGKGLGYHLSLAYASARASGLIISSRTQSDLDALEKEIKRVNPDCEVLSLICDTTKQDDLTSLAEKIKDKYGRLDVVIANAGIISAYLPSGALPTSLVDDLDFERVININLTGTAITARTMLPLLLSKDTAEPSPRAFIATTSLASLFPRSAPTTTAYNISKIGVNRLVELLAADHADDGLVAYAIHPGAVVTPQTQRHSTVKGDMWEQALTDDVGLCGGFCTWLTACPMMDIGGD